MWISQFWLKKKCQAEHYKGHCIMKKGEAWLCGKIKSFAFPLSFLVFSFSIHAALTKGINDRYTGPSLQ